MVKLRVLSLGAGVQSTTMCLMAAHGELTPVPDVAIFADTQWEPRRVYGQLEWLREPGRLPFPVLIVTRGDIRENVRTRRDSWGTRFASIPWHIVRRDGTTGMGQRQCSSEYKLTPIMWKIRELLGVSRTAKMPAGTVEVWLGISKDEAHRMKTAHQNYITNRYPLIEKGLRRYDCLKWLEAHDYPIPPKSSCLGCPYHDNKYWRALKRESPAEWADTVEMDRALRLPGVSAMVGTEYMHRNRVPLDEADLELELETQMDLFGEECEGVCGV
jgi:hypothetical protein